MNLTIEQLVLAVIGFLFTISVHGFFFAGIAWLLDCKTPRYEGRLTFNPLTQLDMLGLACAALFTLGWGKPVAIIPSEIRFRVWGTALCVLGSSAATIVAAGLLLFLRFPAETLLPDTPAAVVLAVINATSQVSIWFALFSLLPLPPLAAGQILLGLWPKLRALVQQNQVPTSLIMFVIVATGVPYRLLLGANLSLEDLVGRFVPWLSQLIFGG